LRALAAIAALVALMGLATTLAPRAEAAPGEPRTPIRYEARAALGLDSAPSGWIPVQITMTYADPYAWPGGAGASPDAPERFIVRLASRRWGSGPARHTAVREETLAPGTSKRFFLYAYASEDSQPQVSIVRARDGARAAQVGGVDRFSVSDPNTRSYRYSSSSSGTPAKEEFRVALVSGPGTTALNWLKSIELPNAIEVKLATVNDPWAAPDRRIGWAPFDLVVLHDFPLASLTPAQQEALRSYVHGGGRLMVSPGPDLTWLADPFFRDLLPPGKARGTTRTSFEGNAVEPYTHVRIDGAEALAVTTSAADEPPRLLPSIEELLPPGVTPDMLPEEALAPIRELLDEAEEAAEDAVRWNPGAHKSFGHVVEEALRLSREMLQQYAATGTATARVIPQPRARALPPPVTRWRAGRGEVSLIPFDLAGGPLRGASDALRNLFWVRVFEPYRARSGRHGGGGEQWPVATSDLEDAESLRLLLPDFEVPVLAIAALALGYVVLVGPVNFLALRRIGREPLSVFTVPAIAVMSIFLIVLLGYAWHGGRARTYEAVLTRARPGERLALDTRLLGVIAAGSGVIDIPVHDDEEGIAVSTQDDDAAARGFTTLETRPRSLSGVALTRWEGALARFDSVRDLGGAVSVDFEEQPPIPQDGPHGFVGPRALVPAPPRVFVRNELAQPLERVALYRKGGALWYVADRAPPGERTELLRVKSPSSVTPDESRRLRVTLADRSATHVRMLLARRAGPWALGALLAPEAPREFVRRGDGGAPIAPWGVLPAPSERTRLLVVEGEAAR